MSSWIEDKTHIKSIYEELIDQVEIKNGIRLLGITLSHLNHEEVNSRDEGSGSQLILDF